MTEGGVVNAHFHRGGFETFFLTASREYRFYGIHPWQADASSDAALEALRAQLEADPSAGVGEIGLDRLKNREISARAREVFARQLAWAAELRRPVVLHGAKCWGEVVRACEAYRGRIPAFLFHGFSRSGGLLPNIYALNGFVSVGAAILNDHAVNYRALVATVDKSRLLPETDDDPAADLAAIAAAAGLSEAEAEANAARFWECLA